MNNLPWYLVIGIIVLFLLFSTVLQKLNPLTYLFNNNKGNVSTNTIMLTNYVERIKPKYVSVNITNVVESNNTAIIVMPVNAYSNLIMVVSDESNYSQSDIKAEISNDSFLILTHYATTNIIKLPNLCKDKVNEIIFGGSPFTQKFLLGYGRDLIDTKILDLGVGILGFGNQNSQDILIYGSVKF
jgi:hypothetical protein